ncbi:hypothetical protein BJ875DRAFT_438968 [Amylocarpus encephaloides]|uniref:Uncharacterized protein n=1 Tax=Amylocarpus encephaloides TaxID=45428 RepID=A0A9P8C7Z9_9HELO|nr:hypothetical protein BJ875DRAFT_438968 [Amylocarpus encephaloides]
MATDNKQERDVSVGFPCVGSLIRIVDVNTACGSRGCRRAFAMMVVRTPVPHRRHKTTPVDLGSPANAFPPIDRSSRLPTSLEARGRETNQDQAMPRRHTVLESILKRGRRESVGRPRASLVTAGEKPRGWSSKAPGPWHSSRSGRHRKVPVPAACRRNLDGEQDVDGNPAPSHIGGLEVPGRISHKRARELVGSDHACSRAGPWNARQAGYIVE